MFTESNDHSGTVGFLVGIIVLVFAGIIFSMMVDKQFKFSKGKADLEAAITEEGHQLEALRREAEIARDEYERTSKRASQPAQQEKERLAISTTGDRIRELRKQQAELKREVEAEKTAFAEYRVAFRKQVRQAAVGEKLDQLEVAGGKIYHGVTIRRVHAGGMEVSHSQGSLSLTPDDLANSWRERFQWNAEELAAAPQPAKSAAEKQSPGHQQPVKQDQAKSGSPEKPGKELASLRRDVSEAKHRLDRSEGEVTRIRSEAENSKAELVPGSSETWDERITRLEASSESFRGLYVEARDRLAKVSPGDELLEEKPSVKKPSAK